MIRHSMDAIQRAFEFLNPGQVPVLTVDQPLFAIAKRIQWQWPDTYGEEQFVVLQGGLHIEMAALSSHKLMSLQLEWRTHFSRLHM